MNRSEDYYDDLTSFKETLRTAEKVSAAISALLTFISLCLLSTCLSKQCRAVSAAWYIYFLLVVVVFYGLILCIGMSSPVFYWTDGCVFLHSFFRLVQLLYSSSVVFINIEVFRTIICPSASWMNTKVRRFCFVVMISFGAGLMIVIVTGVYSFQYGCLVRPYWIVEVIIHILKNWIPGVAVIVMTVLNIVGYVKLRRRGLATYNQFVNDSSVAVHPTEWFICVMLINAIFIVFEVLFLHLSVVFLSVIHTHFYVVRFLERLMLIILGYPILVLRSVRQKIVAFLRSICNCSERERAESTHDINMDAIEDDSL